MRQGAPADLLAARIDGELIGPGDPGYDHFRSVFNARVDRRPLAIARCRTTEDVVAALAFCAEQGLRFAVRGGGTSDLATVDDGVVIDLSLLDRIEVDADDMTARVGGGVTWRELDAAAEEHGLAVTGARLPRLGVAGTALAGGSGWLERALGPTCASVIGAEVVLADGRVLAAGDGTAGNADLLRAIRGGGGAGGIVTELELRLHRVGPTLLAGFLGFPRERGGEVAAAYRDRLEDAPAEVGGGLMLGAGGAGACTAVFSFAGAIGDGEEALAPLRGLGPSIDAVAPNPYTSLQQLSDVQNPRGARVHLRGGFLRELPDQALELALEAANRPAPTLSYVLLQPLGGAMSRLDGEAMALNVPDAPWAYQCFGLWPPVASLDAGAIDWVDGIAAALQPYTLPARSSFLAAHQDPGRPAAPG